jgi:Dynamin GTPase effector domain
MLEKTADQTREGIQLYCNIETHRPFTMNIAEYLELKEQCMAAFALDRHPNKPLDASYSGTFRLVDIKGNSRTFISSEENLLSILSDYGVGISSKKQLARVHADEYDAELGVISHVAAYFELSSKRVYDDIPKVFETVFARDFGQNLGRSLTTNLKLVGDRGLENCTRHIRDEPNIQSTRDKVAREQDTLKKALDTVDQFYN